MKSAQAQMDGCTKQLVDTPSLEALASLGPLLDNLLCTLAVRVRGICGAEETGRAAANPFQDWVATVTVEQGTARLPRISSEQKMERQLPYTEFRLSPRDDEMQVTLVSPGSSGAQFKPVTIPIRAHPGVWHHQTEVLDPLPNHKAVETTQLTAVAPFSNAWTSLLQATSQVMAEGRPKLEFEYHFASSMQELQGREIGREISSQPQSRRANSDDTSGFLGPPSQSMTRSRSEQQSRTRNAGPDSGVGEISSPSLESMNTSNSKHRLISHSGASSRVSSGRAHSPRGGGSVRHSSSRAHSSSAVRTRPRAAG